MLDSWSSLPLWLSTAIAIVVTCGVGYLVYWGSTAVLADSKDIEGRAGNNLFRVTGFLFSLMISLAFTSVVDDARSVEQAVRAETAAIADVLQGLEEYGDPAADAARESAVAYTELVISDDWPALEDDELSPAAGAALRRLTAETLELSPTNAAQEERQSRLLDDIDAMSDARRARLNAALEGPSVFFYVLFLGFLLTMVLFGMYKRRPKFVALLMCYAGFIGIVINLIVILSDPFGPLGFEPSEFVSVLESQQAG